MLEMKQNCERCKASLESEAEAFICSYECTFCGSCSREMEGVCPNCSGELLARPRRGKSQAAARDQVKWDPVLTGSCHCGNVRFELAQAPESRTECNCSICRRYGAQWAYYTRQTARVILNPGTVTSYSWNDREIEFMHCNDCGCMTHYESMEKNPDSRIAVNTRMLDAIDVAGIPLRYFDGADTWKYIKREEKTPE